MGFNARDILKAWTMDAPKEDWYMKRLEICASCPLNSLNVKEKNIKEQIRESLGGIFKEAYCTACGCTITQKAKLKKSACGLQDVGKTPLWYPLEYDSIANNDQVKITQPDGQKYEIRRTDVVEILLGEVEDNMVEFFVDVKHKKPLEFARVNGTCSCTATNTEVVEKNTHRINIKISTKGFTVGEETKKTIKVTHLNTQTGYEQVTPIRCRLKKKNPTTLS